MVLDKIRIHLLHNLNNTTTKRTLPVAGQLFNK